MSGWLDDEIERGEKNASESSGIAMNSYGAGYDRGYADALRAVKDQLGPGYFIRCEGCDGHECISECAYPGVNRR